MYSVYKIISQVRLSVACTDVVGNKHRLCSLTDRNYFFHWLDLMLEKASSTLLANSKDLRWMLYQKYFKNQE